MSEKIIEPVSCSKTVQAHILQKDDKFHVWEGTDFWHKSTDVQVRLEDDGRVYVSTGACKSIHFTLKELSDVLSAAVDEKWEGVFRNAPHEVR